MSMIRLGSLAVGALLAQALFAQQNPVQFIAAGSVIDQPGSYALSRNLNVSDGQTGVMITASGVTLDLNGFEIGGIGRNTGTGIQIMNATGVRVHNGRLSRLGFGVTVMNSASVTLRDLDIRGAGLLPPEVGVMIMQSSGVVVERNNFANVGLGIFVRGGMSHGNRIVDNNLVSLNRGPLAICYNPTPTDTRSPSGDLISGNTIYGFNGGIQMAATSGVNMIRGNTIFYYSFATELNDSPSREMENSSAQIR
ncbi:hypothetical protein F183_A15330 [Bryobacterales bacterium F-183]|nr:hypothetical protein F183_A15330 [Bryobacterales bacterium F-183]